MELTYRYFLTRSDVETEVSKREYINAERSAGFRSKFGPDEVATASFGYTGPFGESVFGRTEVVIPED